MDDSSLSASQWAELVANCRCQFGDVPEDKQPEVKRLLDKLFEQETLPVTHKSYTWDSQTSSLIPDETPSNSIWNQMAAWRWN